MDEKSWKTLYGSIGGYKCHRKEKKKQKNYFNSVMINFYKLGELHKFGIELNDNQARVMCKRDNNAILGKRKRKGIN